MINNTVDYNINNNKKDSNILKEPLFKKPTYSKRRYIQIASVLLVLISMPVVIWFLGRRVGVENLATKEIKPYEGEIIIKFKSEITSDNLVDVKRQTGWEDMEFDKLNDNF